jgi:hypothetical protein
VAGIKRRRSGCGGGSCEHPLFERSRQILWEQNAQEGGASMARNSIETRTPVIGILTLLAMVCFFPRASRADNITVTVDGTEYFVSTITGSFTDNMAQLESSPWWNNQTLAQEIAGAVMDDIGTPNEFNGEEGGGPLFAWDDDAIDAFVWFQGTVNPTSPSESGSFTYACGCSVGTATSGACAGKSCEPAVAPEPSSLALFPLGLGALLVIRRRMCHVRPSAI